MKKTLREQWGSETRFTQHLAKNIEDLNKVNRLLGLPKIVKAENEVSIPGGSIDVVGYTSKGEAVIYEHQDLTERADQTHVNKTVGYPIQLKIKTGVKILASILLCGEVDEHFIKQFKQERKYYAKRKYDGHKNLHFVKSQWGLDGSYQPSLFDESEIIKTKESQPLNQFQKFVEIYGRDWSIIGEEKRPTTITLWFKDISKGRHYIHKLKTSYKVGIHFDNPSQEEKNLITEFNGRHNKKRSTYEKEFGFETNEYDLWLESEKIRQKIRLFYHG